MCEQFRCPTNTLPHTLTHTHTPTYTQTLPHTLTHTHTPVGIVMGTEENTACLLSMLLIPYNDSCTRLFHTVIFDTVFINDK